jgi:hypothetical protein
MNHGSPHRAPVRSVWIPTFRRIMSHQFLLGYTSKCNTINTELHINHIIQPYIYISFVLFSINHRDSLSLLGKKNNSIVSSRGGSHGLNKIWPSPVQRGFVKQRWLTKQCMAIKQDMLDVLKHIMLTSKLHYGHKLQCSETWYVIYDGWFGWVFPTYFKQIHLKESLDTSIRYACPLESS